MIPRLVHPQFTYFALKQHVFKTSYMILVWMCRDNQIYLIGFVVLSNMFHYELSGILEPTVDSNYSLLVAFAVQIPEPQQDCITAFILAYRQEVNFITHN